MVDNVVEKFEKVSGAILSRNQKCQVIGFGKWRNKQDWPLEYVRTVTEMKIFGVFIQNSVTGLVRKNWEYRFAKFRSTIISWSSRILDTIYKKVASVKMFAFSRLYYIASVFPVPKAMCKQIDKIVGRFIWSLSGKILRVSNHDMKNVCEIRLK